jgi:excisionase family DNA binding protein
VAVTDKLLLSVRDAARRLGVGRDHCYRLVREGRLRSIAIGGRRLIPVTELAAFVDREIGGDAMRDTTPGDGRAPIRSVD